MPTTASLATLEQNNREERAKSDDQSSLTLTVVVPVYNERYFVRELLSRVLTVVVPGIANIEVVVVDDGSTDGTWELLQEFSARHQDRLRLLRHSENRGKGAALRSGILDARGDLVVFQDADLEYDPADYQHMIQPFLQDGADVVYGSRFMTRDRRRVLYFRHTLGNRVITFLSNLFTDLNLSDVETCYKMFRAPLLRSIPIRSNGFSVEIELTAKVAKRNCRVFEVPISYLGRTYREGKKIKARDALKALVTMVRFWVVDDVYTEDEYGSNILHNLERVRRFNRWMADTIRPFVGNLVLEVGAGIGNITHFLAPRDRYVATDIHAAYIDYLEKVALGKPYMEVARLDIEEESDFAGYSRAFETIICLNVLEHVQDPVKALRNMASALAPGGKIILYVPQGQRLYSRLDKVLEHRCRYTRTALEKELGLAGLECELYLDFNRSSTPGWWLNGKVLRRSQFSRIQLKMFDLAVPLLKRIDHLFPWKGLGIVAVAQVSS